MSKKKKILATGGGTVAGALTGLGIAKATDSIGVGIITGAKTGLGVKAAPALAALGAMAVLSASAVVLLFCREEKKKYSWQ